MKKQTISPVGKKMNLKEMKAIKGGIWGGLWVCTDNYRCFFDPYVCESKCPEFCLYYDYCP